MLGRLQEFGVELRRMGVPVSNHEMLVAAQALEHVDFTSRTQFRSALATAMCRSESHLGVFSLLFDLFFGPPGGVRAELDASDSRLKQLIAAALAAGDEPGLRGLVRILLDRMTEDVADGFLLYRALRFLDLDQSATEAPVENLRLKGRRGRLKAILTQEVRRRMVSDRGPAEVASRLNSGPLEEKDFATITSDEVAEVRRAVMALARRLQTRLAKMRRQGREGRLDMRQTFRRALSSGGALINPRFRVKSPHRPDLVLLCDVSGSVAAFTRFTLLLVACLQIQFPRVRSFLFIDTIDEVTEVLKSADPAEAIPRALEFADVVQLDGHSDYGNSFRGFVDRYLNAVGNRSQVIVLGDARGNYRTPETLALKELSMRAKKLWWLNPEPRRYWDTGDSVISDYATYCERVVECRNLKQLAAFVERLAVA